MQTTFHNKDIDSRAIRIAVSVDNTEVGHAYLFLITNDLHTEPYGLLEDVMIDEDQRGNGIGTKVIQQVIDTAKEVGCYKLLATSRFSREKVHALYERFGFEKHGFEFRLNIGK